VADAAPQLDRRSLPLLELAGERRYTAAFRDVWPTTLDWIEPFYDAEHLRRTVIWMLRLDPAASEPLLAAALTHDMERHFPGGTQPDRAAGAWDDVEYNTRHARRSAVIVSEWLRRHGMSRDFVDRVIPPILEHEFGGSPDGNLIQAADSLSFLDVNAGLVARWVLGGETTIELGKRKLEWMFERIQIERARELARPVYEAALSAVDREVGGSPAR
jgi:hypothetical protein